MRKSGSSGLSGRMSSHAAWKEAGWFKKRVYIYKGCTYPSVWYSKYLGSVYYCIGQDSLSTTAEGMAYHNKYFVTKIPNQPQNLVLLSSLHVQLKIYTGGCTEKNHKEGRCFL